MMEIIIAGLVVVLVAGVSAAKLDKKHKAQMKQLEMKHNWEMFSKEIELTQAHVELAIAQCNELRAAKQYDIEICNEALRKIDGKILADKIAEEMKKQARKEGVK